jgi:hypothetical protein
VIAGIEISRLGIMVARSSDGTQITAVRGGGPAFLAGLQPGDILVRVGTFAEPTPESLASLPWQQIRRIVRYAHSTVEVIDVEARYIAQGTPQSLTTAVRVWMDGRGTWITTQLDHPNTSGSPRPELPGVIEARAVPAAYDALYEQTVDKIAANPCEMAGQTAQLAAALEEEPEGYGSTFMLNDSFRDMTFRGCQNTKDPLPEFESLLVAMVAGDLDACTYKPGSDVSAAIARARVRITKLSYDEYTGPNTPHVSWIAGNACARAFIVSELTGAR